MNHSYCKTTGYLNQNHFKSKSMTRPFRRSHPQVVRESVISASTFHIPHHQHHHFYRHIYAQSTTKLPTPNNNWTPKPPRTPVTSRSNLNPETKKLMSFKKMNANWLSKWNYQQLPIIQAAQGSPSLGRPAWSGTLVASGATGKFAEPLVESEAVLHGESSEASIWGIDIPWNM